MQLVLVPIAFAAGVITAFTPCILPVLPIVLAAGSTGTRRRPYAIVAGLVLTFTAFLLAGAWLWSLIGIDEKNQLKIGAVLLLLLAVTLVVPRVGELLERPFQFLTRRRSGDLGGGFLLGASLGLVFVPCGGPVLAAVSANVGSHRVNGWTVIAAIAYGLGAALPMLLIAQGSRRAAASLRAHATTVRVASAVLMAGAAVVLYNGWAEDLQTKVPAYAAHFQNWIEGNNVADDQLADLQRRDRRQAASEAVPEPQAGGAAAEPADVALRDYGAAPDFAGISSWLNTSDGGALSLSDLRGKVVLVDFWTYSCINCLRTLPHLEAWDARYRSGGLVIVGVHTPEFAFEHDIGNVRSAVRRLGVRYPVALDNDYETWNAYSNQYWPAEYLLDQAGHIRHVHFGEGRYDETERTIRVLLQAGGRSRLPAETRKPDTTPTVQTTPESYLGYQRLDRYAGSPLGPDTATRYRFPATLPLSHLAYAGVWKVEAERIVAGADARLRLRFRAQKVHLVLGGKGRVRIFLNGHGTKTVGVSSDKLYTLVSQPRDREGLLELAFTPGVAAYAFTFG